MVEEAQHPIDEGHHTESREESARRPLTRECSETGDHSHTPLEVSHSDLAPCILEATYQLAYHHTDSRAGSSRRALPRECRETGAHSHTPLALSHSDLAPCILEATYQIAYHPTLSHHPSPSP